MRQQPEKWRDDYIDENGNPCFTEQVNENVSVFEEDEKERIRYILSSLEPVGVDDKEIIIHFIEMICNIEKIRNLERERYVRSTFRDNRAALFKICDDLHMYMSTTSGIFKPTGERPLIRNDGLAGVFKETGEGPLIKSDGLSSQEGDKQYSLSLYSNILKCFNNLFPALCDLMDTLDDIDAYELSNPGRPPVDDTYFVFTLARLFMSTYGKKPTNYKDGPFYKLVQEVYKITGTWTGDSNNPDKEPDVSRIVRAVIRKLE